MRATNHRLSRLFVWLLVSGLGHALVCWGGEPVSLENVVAPSDIAADEPMAADFSLTAAAHYLDSAAISWQKEHACTACHTMVSYMMARQALHSVTPTPFEVRRFFEEVVDGRREAMPNYQCHDVEGAVAITVAASLVFDDRYGSGQLHPLTRRALDRMWQFQLEDGSWVWPFRDTPPLKLRPHFGTTLAAIVASTAPDNYAETELARKGLAAIRSYLRASPPESLHEEAMLVWASTSVSDLLSDDERRKSLDRLLAAQRPDGGWSMASLVENPRAPATGTAELAARLRAEPGYGGEFLVYAGHDSAYKTSLASDGYATGFVIYVARQAGILANDERLQRGIQWLKTHQRASGRWYTPSQAWHTQNRIANFGTAYAVLALEACGQVPAPEGGR